MYVGSFNYFALIYFTIHMGPNCYINTGVALFKAASTRTNGISSENILNRPIYAEINTHIFDRILHSTLATTE